jgi:hypothetical protein
MPLPPIDHLVWGGHNLEQEIERLEALTGVRALPGGRHTGEGTWNAILGLGPGRYLELITPDPGQPAPRLPRWLGLDTLAAPRLLTWAAKTDDLELRASATRALGVPLGEVRTGRRELGGGGVISWRLTYPDLQLGDGLVPFLIDWGESRHPSDTAPAGLELVDLWAEHPEPATVLDSVRHLGLALRVVAGPRPALIAELNTRRGRIVLR